MKTYKCQSWLTLYQFLFLLPCLLFLFGLPGAVLAGPFAPLDPVAAVDTVSNAVAKYNDLEQKLDEFAEKTAPLDKDAGAEADYNPPGMPEIPVSCGDSNECWHCYKDANENMQKLRGNFEKLRLLYKETDEFTKAAIAFGDGMAGSTGVAALEWNVQRDKIKKSFNNFENSYRAKHAELLEKMKSNLEEIAKCEKEYFNEDDWYARYGFMFQSFIAMHYQR